MNCCRFNHTRRSLEDNSKEVKRQLGDKESELIRNIVLAYLSEKGYLKDEEK